MVTGLSELFPGFQSGHKRKVSQRLKPLRASLLTHLDDVFSCTVPVLAGWHRLPVIGSGAKTNTQASDLT